MPILRIFVILLQWILFWILSDTIFIAFFYKKKLQNYTERILFYRVLVHVLVYNKENFYFYTSHSHFLPSIFQHTEIRIRIVYNDIIESRQRENSPPLKQHICKMKKMRKICNLFFLLFFFYSSKTFHFSWLLAMASYNNLL